jgi:hypothetical protein
MATQFAKNTALKAIEKEYEKYGQDAAIVLYEKQYKHLGILAQCDGCQTKTPHIDASCVVCGEYNNEIISKEIEQLSKHAKTEIQKKLISFLKANQEEIKEALD